MNKKKSIKIALVIWSILAVIIYAFSVLMIIGGTKVANDDLVVCGAMLLILFSVVFVWEFISLLLKLKKENKKEKVEALVKENNKLRIEYSTLKTGEATENNVVAFVNQGLKFKAKGKFVCVENFNNTAGYHFAFRIEGEKLISKPENYNDFVGYENCLFNIDLAYFDGFALSTPENECGIKVRTLENLAGKVVKVDPTQGYMATIDTAETDDIDVGEIKFEEWTDKSKAISFKLLVNAGINDIITGKVSLTEDKFEK